MPPFISAPARGRTNARASTARRISVWLAERRWPLLGAVLVGAALLVVAARHEMWRDELQAWLIARDAPLPWNVAYNARYEGHPCLWYLVLWLPAHLSPDPRAMQLVHILIASLGAFLVFRFSPFPLTVKLALVASYFLFYEWGVLARNYALSALLVFALCTAFRRRWERFLTIAILLALLAQTNLHSLILCGTTSFALTVELLLRRRHGLPIGPRRNLWLGYAAIGISMLISAAQIYPPSDTAVLFPWTLGLDAAKAKWAATTILRAYAPIPVDGIGFWNTNVLALNLDHWAAGPLILAAASLLFIKQPKLLLFFFGSSLALVAYFYAHHPGASRHHGFLFLVFVAAAWIAPATLPVQYRQPRLERCAALIDRHRMIPLLVVLLVHDWGSWIAVKNDWKYKFSNAGDVARWLRNAGDLGDVVIAAYPIAEAASVVGQVPLESVYYPAIDERGSYGVTGAKLLEFMRLGSRSTAVARKRMQDLVRTTGRDAILIVTAAAADSFSGPGVERLATFAEPATTGEAYVVLRWSRPGS